MSEAGSSDLPDEGLVDLLVKQVTERLSPAEQRELDVLDGPATSELLRDLERAAAAVAVAGSAHPPSLPELLRARIERQAGDFFAPAAASTPLAQAPAATAAPPTAAAPRPPLAVGWWAAAACFLFGLYAWFRTPPERPVARVNPAAVVAPVVQVPPPPAAVAPTPAEARAALLADPDAMKLSLGATQDPSARGVTGDVVWDPKTQRGFVRFSGLAPNDPNVRQYQIWLFDAKRDPRYPVDGGVFDVPADQSEVIVPIHAEVVVREAKAFAVTLEKAGGAVVSAREHLIALGQAT